MSDAKAMTSGGLPPFLAGVLPECDPEKADLLAHDPPAFDTAMAADIALRLYGVSGAIKPLSAEKDANFLIVLPTGEEALLKITNAVEDRAVTDMQTAALMRLASADPTLPVQRICASLKGNASETVNAADGQSHVVRLLTYLSGTILSSATAGPGLHHALGDLLARVTLGLRGFFHPAAGHVLQWDIKQAGQLRPLVSAVQDGDLRDRLDKTLDRFDAMIAPRLPHLRAQVVHNDFNPHNVLVNAPEATHPIGLIDFGDMVHTPIVCDLAVACSYQIGEGADPLRQMCAMVAGYASRLPLEREEVELLPTLIRLRHATTLAIGASRAQRYPDNTAYILRNAGASLRGLDALDRLGDVAAIKALHAALGTE
ncbi:MAG: hydroxylysine kinase [Paracoccaceae bacterium]|jgi:hydroxylysine kinase